MSDTIKELGKFLHLGSRLDLKAVALEHILGLTGTDDGIKEIINIPEILVALISLLDDKNSPIAKDSCLCLVNITANEQGANALLKLDVTQHCPPLQKPPNDIIKTCLNCIFNEESSIADPCCMVLSNVSRPSHLIEKVIDIMETTDKTFDELINIFTKKQYNKRNAKLDYLGPFLSNLSQSSRVRKYILDKNKHVVQRLLPFTGYKESLVRRGGVIGTLKNCCFEEDHHEWLLSEDVDILPSLLLPLAGNEEFDDEDNDGLPFDLQYLPQDKQREEDPDLRSILLEALTLLCTKRNNREYVRNKNTYLILRELHKWEKDRKALLACENLVDILIRTEEEIAKDNLKDVEVPHDMHERFHKMDNDFINDVE